MEGRLSGVIKSPGVIKSLVYHGWFELVFSLLEILSSAYENKYLGMFKKKIFTPNRGDSNEYVQRTIILPKIEKTSINYPFCLMTWRNNKPSVAQNTHV